MTTAKTGRKKKQSSNSDNVTAEASESGKKTGKRKDTTLSAIDAAAQVLQQAGQPMNCKEMIEAMAEQGLWTSPHGKTPQATLYASILREMKVRKSEARFKKTERGKFAAR